MLPRIAPIVTVCALLAVPADAQIYAWRDVNGTLVLSDRKLESDARTYAVPGAPQIRVTRPATPRASRNRNRFDSLIREHAGRQSLRPELVRAVIQVESGFDPRAVSPKGAMGLMQLMPATARELGVSNPYDPAENIRGGTTYLRRLIDRYDGNEELALAAYNAGSKAVDRYGGTVPPYRETREYVKRVGSVKKAAIRANRGAIYKWIEIVDGRPVPRYASDPPAGINYEVVRQR